MLTVLVGAAVTVTTVPCLVFAAECLLAPEGREAEAGGAPLTAAAGTLTRPRVAVLIPAHDEEGTIGAVVANVRSQLVAGDRVLVVADNCGDATAERARAAGAEVVERREPERRGKGYALAFGVERLGADPPAVVVIVDADCVVDEGAIEVLAHAAHRQGGAVQAEYLLTAEPGAPAARRLVAFAILVKNRVRPRGAARLGWPCQLTGSGMAFPWRQLEAAAPLLGGNIVEDMLLGVTLTLAGSGPRLEPRARVSSRLPTSSGGTASQRRRWETGHLATLVEQVPRLLRAGARGDGEALGLGLDLAVPPLTLLVLAQAGALVVAGGVGIVAAHWGPFMLAGLGGGALGAGVFRAWSRFGRDTVTSRELLTVPRYMAAKIPMYLLAAWRGQEKSWVRTARDTTRVEP